MKAASIFGGLVLILILCAGCDGSELPREELILGTWKVDSLKKVYNQFSSTEPGDAAMPTYEYLPGNKVRERKGNDFREYRCEWTGTDTLMYRSPEGDTIGLYQILELRPHRLVLKKPQPNIFSGEGQDRFEIRFFSRLEELR